MSQLPLAHNTLPRRREGRTEAHPSGGRTVFSNPPSPEGSHTLGTTLYINDIDVGLNSFIAKFPDDTKMENSVISDRDRQSLQDDEQNFNMACKMGNAF